MQIPRIDPKNAAGLVDKIVGLGKEIVGTVASNERLTKAGQIQQEKGTERLKAIQGRARGPDTQGQGEIGRGEHRRPRRTSKETVNN